MAQLVEISFYVRFPPYHIERKILKMLRIYNLIVHYQAKFKQIKSIGVLYFSLNNQFNY